MRTLSELKNILNTLENPPLQYKIGVGSLIFRDDNRVILLERGARARDEQGKLEGVGGSVDSEDDLHAALLREIAEELGDEVKVRIDTLLTVLVLPGEHDPWWVVPIYLCRLLSGVPKNMEPEKCSAIHYCRLQEINPEKLSRFQRETMKVYSEKYGYEVYYRNKA